MFREDIFPAVWDAALEHGIDPVVMVAQSLLETGKGNFTVDGQPGGKPGVVNASYRNTCGLKTRTGGDNSDPDAHARFPDWATGARAHAQHLIRYTGAIGFTSGEKIVDPRWDLVGPPPVTTVAGLEGRWATSPGYAQKIMDIARRLIGDPS